MLRKRKSIRPAVVKSVRNALETLEGRALFNASYFNLSGGSLVQDWESNYFSTGPSDWANVPSIEAYSTDRANVINPNLSTSVLNELPVGTGTDTRALTMTPNATNGNGSAGGAHEVQLATPITGTSSAGTVSTGNITVGLQSSDSANDEVYLQFYVNNSGRTTPVHVRYDLIDIDSTANTNTTGTAQAQFAVQYRVGTTGNFAFVPNSRILNAANFTSGSVGTANTFDLTLPDDTIGAAQVQFRIITANTSGADQMVAIDNIKVFGNDAGPGTLEVSSPEFVSEGQNAVYTITRPASSTGAITVDYALSGSATAGSDYSGPATGTISFGANEISKTVTVPIIDDTNSEGTETLTLTLSNATGGASILTASSTTIIRGSDTSAPATGSILLNEIVMNPADDDLGGEYVEIRGTPGQSLNNVYFVSIEGDGGSDSGIVDVVVDLSGYTIGSNGLAIIKAAGQPFFPNVPAGTTIIDSAVFAVSGGVLETGTNTFGLFFNLTPPAQGVDLDTTVVTTGSRYTGEFNNLPADTTILDLIGIYDTAANGTSVDRAYGPIVFGFASLPNVNGADALTRIVGDNTAATSPAVDPAQSNATSWYGGDLIDPNPVDQSAPDYNGIAYSNVNASPNKPAGAAITPGAPNYPTSANPGQLGFGPTRYTVSESDGVATVTIYRTGGTAGTVSVSYSTGPGAAGRPATAGADYTATTGTITFGPGETVKTFTVPIIDDAEIEQAETIELTLSNPTGGATLVTPGTARITISANDSSQPSSLLINEFETNPPGNEGVYEYIELKGEPNRPLLDVYLLVFEGSGAGSGGAGTLDSLYDLSGAVLGSNGLLLVRPSTSSFAPVDPASGTFEISGLTFESDTSTFMLVYKKPDGFLPTVGTDYDQDNTGELSIDTPDFLPRLDSIGWLDGDDITTPTNVNIVYSPTVLPPVADRTGGGGGSTWFGGATRFPESTASAPTDWAAHWYYGTITDFGNEAGHNAEVNYATTPGRNSPNTPAGAKLTPGGANVLTPSDTTAPTVDSVTFNRATQKVTVVFSEDVSASIAAADFTLVNNTVAANGATLVVSSISADGKTVTLSFANTGGLKPTILKDGNYTLTVKAGQVADAANNTLAADFTSAFFFKNADLDGDRDVDFADLLTLAKNYNGTGKTFAQGDTDLDGDVDFADLLTLAKNYNQKLVAPAAASTASATPTRKRADASAFSSSSVIA